MVNLRRRRNTIHMLQLEDGSWTIDPKIIRRSFTNHFKEIYCGPEQASPDWPEELLFSLSETVPQLEEEQGSSLEEMPTPKEIRRAVFSLGPNRAPGPDGINARFAQMYWDLLRPRIELEIEQFFSKTVMRSTISKSNMVLIPKCENPTKVTDYRPISICNVIYKIISKILANRLKPHMLNLIHPN